MVQHERNKDRQSGEQSKTDRSMDQQQGTSDSRNRQGRGAGQRQNISGGRDDSGRDSDMNRGSERRGGGSEDEERGVI